jgi:hypothetical protein
MRFFVAICLIGLISCRQSSGEIDSRQSGSMVFSLPDIKNPEHARLVSGYRLQIIKASGDCSNPTSLDVVRSYESRKPIEVAVVSGCDYWLKLEAGDSGTSTSSSLANVYLSNMDGGSEGTLVENKYFAGVGVYRVRIPLKVTEDGKRLGLDQVDDNPWDFSNESPTYIHIDSFIDANKRPNIDRQPDLSGFDHASNPSCPGLVGLEKTKTYVSLKFDQFTAGTFSNPIEEPIYNCSIDLDLSEWSKLRSLRFEGDRDLKEGRYFSILTSLRSSYGDISALTDVSRVYDSGRFEIFSREFGLELTRDKRIIIGLSVARIPATSLGSELRFSEIRVYLQ